MLSTWPREAVDDPQSRFRVDAGFHVSAATDTGVVCLADGARSKTRARPVGYAFVERGAQNGDIDLTQFRRIEHERSTEEGNAGSSEGRLCGTKWTHSAILAWQANAGAPRWTLSNPVACKRQWYAMAGRKR